VTESPEEPAVTEDPAPVPVEPDVETTEPGPKPQPPATDDGEIPEIKKLQEAQEKTDPATPEAEGQS
jgi:hypothetical protein